ncbi:MAG: Ppx/GppA family phosphatase [Synergistaceae bacterium]|nr:Ppx/GppA family phosphatase [Synergistaceae bacterium]
MTDAGRGGIKAVIDVGTNSVKLLVAERARRGIDILGDFVSVTRLGDGVSETGSLSCGAMERTASVIDGFARRARELGALEIHSVGTQAMRTARNADNFIAAVKDACGVEIRVISGEEEAELSFCGASSEEAGCLCVFDVGGGSSEIVSGRLGRVQSRASVPTGALSLFQKFFRHERAARISEETINRACSYVRTLVADARTCVHADACAGVGGTAVSLASVYIKNSGSPGKIDGAVLSAGEITRQINMYAGMDSYSRKSIPGLPGERSDIILPGACILRELMKTGPFAELTVRDRGLRHGLMKRMLK